MSKLSMVGGVSAVAAAAAAAAEARAARALLSSYFFQGRGQASGCSPQTSSPTSCLESGVLSAERVMEYLLLVQHAVCFSFLRLLGCVKPYLGVEGSAL